MRQLLIILLILLPISSLAEIYQSTDAQGVTVFSDKKTKQSKRVKLAPINTYSEPSSTKEELEEKKEQKKPYKVLAISSPDDETTLHNIPAVEVVITTDPSLQPKHSIGLFVNGKQASQPQRDLVFSIPTLERGAYKITASVFDEEYKEIDRSEPITIFVQRNSILFNTNKNNENQQEQDG